MKHLIFDFDGTLVDSFGLIDYCLAKTSADFGKNYSQAEYRKFFGINEEGLFIKIFEKEDVTEEFCKYCENYAENHEKFFKDFYPGIRDLLEKYLKLGVPMHIITGRSNESLLISLTKLDAFKYFKSWIPGDKYKIAKKENFEKFLSSRGFLPENAIYVGDSHSDFRSAKEAGLDCISALFIYDHAKEKLDRDNHENVVYSVSELEQKLDKFLNLKEEK